MSFYYEVMTEQEALAERYQLLNEGIYEGVVTSSTDTQSSTGNPMMDITITVYDKNGKEYNVRDFLVFTKNMMWKVISFCNSAGLSKEYEQGALCSSLVINKKLFVKVAIEEGREIPEDKLKGKPQGSKYPDKNKIAEYRVTDNNEDKKEKSNTVSDSDFKDDDLPF